MTVGKHSQDYHFIWDHNPKSRLCSINTLQHLNPKEQELLPMTNIKITALKACQMRDTGQTLVKIETDAGITGYDP
jgi:hypothetical protein